MIALLRIAGFVFLLLTAGCAGVKERTPPGEPVAARPPQADAAKEEAVVVKPEPRPASPPAAEPAAPVAKADAPAAAAPPQAPAPVAVAPPKAPAPVAVTPPKPPAPVAPPAVKPSQPPAVKPSPPPVVKPSPPPAAKPPPLDLAALEKRLKETSAIGVFTKLTLKNQVDELLDRFRDHYEGRVRITLAQLRQPYDTLILKLLTLLQDNDPSLARAVAESREAIWGILSDPGKFKSL